MTSQIQPVEVFQCNVSGLEFRELSYHLFVKKEDGEEIIVEPPAEVESVPSFYFHGEKTLYVHKCPRPECKVMLSSLTLKNAKGHCLKHTVKRKNVVH